MTCGEQTRRKHQCKQSVEQNLFHPNLIRQFGSQQGRNDGHDNLGRKNTTKLTARKSVIITARQDTPCCRKKHQSHAGHKTAQIDGD